jgi:uncharacterized protein (DUF58 family)
VLTASGWSLLLTATGLAAAAVPTEYPQFAALAGGCVLVLLLARMTTPEPRLDVTLAWQEPRVAHGRRATLYMSAKAPGRRHRATWVSGVVTPDDGDPELLTGVLGALPSEGEGCIALTTRPLARGRYTVGTLELACTDLLGLVRRTIRVERPLTLLVHPELADARTVRRFGAGDEDAAAGTGPRQPGDAFVGLRPYQPGDDVRHLDWRATARTRTPVVRELIRPTVARQVVILDTAAAYASRGDFETAVSIAASLAVAAAATSDTWLLSTTGLRHHCGPGSTRNAILDPMAELRQSAGNAPTRSAQPSPDAPVIVVTGASAHEGGWRRLSGRRATSVVRVGQEAGARSGQTDVLVTSLAEFERAWMRRLRRSAP